MPDAERCRICGGPRDPETCRVHDQLLPAALPDDRWLGVLDWTSGLFGDPQFARAGYLACRALGYSSRPETKGVLATIQEERRLQRGNE